MFQDNLKIFLQNLPAGVADDEKAKMAELSEKQELTGDEKKSIIDFGRRAFPGARAYMKIFNSCCRKREEAGIHNLIKDESVRARFEKFLKDGGDIEKLRRKAVEEEYLSAADIELFRQAEAEMHKEVAKETQEEMYASRKAEFEEYSREAEAEAGRIDGKLAALREFAGNAPEWNAEILAKVGELEERWVNFSNEPAEQDLSELLEYYGSVANLET